MHFPRQKIIELEDKLGMSKHDTDVDGAASAALRAVNLKLAVENEGLTAKLQASMDDVRELQAKVGAKDGVIDRLQEELLRLRGEQQQAPEASAGTAAGGVGGKLTAGD